MNLWINGHLLQNKQFYWIMNSIKWKKTIQIFSEWMKKVEQNICTMNKQIIKKQNASSKIDS